ncbi:MAG: hypothetical protein E7407_01305 [Ruminococcaceae bacterium]|nr:hypothetical protein [Oscillospiraceae bacterium]
METKYYNRSNNFSAPIRKEPKPYTPENIYREEEIKKESISCKEKKYEANEIKSVLSNFKSDDLLLLGIIFLLLSDSNTDILLVFALGYVFLSSHRK